MSRAGGVGIGSDHLKIEIPQPEQAVMRGHVRMLPAGRQGQAERRLDRVVELTVDTEEVVGRLLKRAQEQGRADDTADVIRRRLEVYFDQTAPLVAVYRERGILLEVDGMGDVVEVTERILSALRD